METHTTNNRETFTSKFGILVTMVGVAVGLGNVWRFPYMVWEFGGSVFVFIYLLAVLLIGIPALMAEWALGRHTGRGPLGAYARGGLWGGTALGRLIFFVVTVAVGYYTAAIGWVGYHAIGQLMGTFGIAFNPNEILPPDSGFSGRSFGLQLMMTSSIILLGGIVLVFGLKKGIERASKIIVPTLFVILLILVVRALTLEGAMRGVKWCMGSFDITEIKASTVAAAMGQAVFSLSLGGSFMVIYGSYLNKQNNIPKNAVFTGLGDTIAGLLAAIAIIPAAAALNPGLQFNQFGEVKGAKLLFVTLPEIFELMPAGGLFGVLFFAGLFGAAFLSALAALEVLVGGITDNTKLPRKKAIVMMSIVVLVLSIPPMINMKIFIPWDLTFGSGMQVLGSLAAVITCVWCVKRSKMLTELASGTSRPFPPLLYWWMRWVVPAIIILVGVFWFVNDVYPYIMQILK